QVPTLQRAGSKVWATNEGYAGDPFVDTPGYSGRTQAWMAWKMKLDGWHNWQSIWWIDLTNLYDSHGRAIPYSVYNAAPSKYMTDTWNQPLNYDEARNPRWVSDATRINGNGVLFYPGTPVGLREPLASFSLKSLRRGFEDYEYLWLLQQRGLSADDVVA